MTESLRNFVSHLYSCNMNCDLFLAMSANEVNRKYRQAGAETTSPKKNKSHFGGLSTASLPFMQVRLYSRIQGQLWDKTSWILKEILGHTSLKSTLSLLSGNWVYENLFSLALCRTLLGQSKRNSNMTSHAERVCNQNVVCC